MKKNQQPMNAIRQIGKNRPRWKFTAKIKDITVMIQHIPDARIDFR